MDLTPYIMFHGQCEEALNFYARVFNGEIKDLSRYEGSPVEGMSKDNQKVMHATFIGEGITFMASDSSEDMQPGSSGMVHLSLNTDSVQQQEKIFQALSEGGRVTMPLQDTFWGARFGMLTDRFGIHWMFNQELKQS